MKIGIALSGGGIRGIAHAGALQALEENGIIPQIIGGTSCGSMVAALYAMGYSPYHIYILCKRYAKVIAKANTMPIISGIHSYIHKKTINITGINNGEKIEELYNMVANRRGINNLNEVKMPVVIPAVDMITGKECVFTSKIPKQKNQNKIYINKIDVGKAVRASSSFPAYFSPCKHKEYAFMDGGALNNVPVDEVIAQGADFVIAIKFHTDEVTQDSNVMDVVMKTIDIMGSKISEENLEMADYVLDIYTDRVGLLDTNKLDKCFQYGYDAVVDNIEKIKQNMTNHNN